MKLRKEFILRKFKNVCEATLQRLDYIFTKFNHIIIAFSGGKESGILVELVNQFCKKNLNKTKISVYHLDYEGGYSHTSQYIRRTMGKYPEFDFFKLE